jgi:hypothetical protein
MEDELSYGNFWYEIPFGISKSQHLKKGIHMTMPCLTPQTNTFDQSNTLPIADE